MQNAVFGAFLKDWRSRRRMSQLDLALHADVSSRHISFLETGRSRPSRSMVHRLCERLDIPLQARNQLLSAAGLSPSYENRAFENQDMTEVRAALDWMLERHHPYPAMAVDKHWRIVKLNGMAQALFAIIGLGVGDSVLEAIAGEEAVRNRIENIDEVVAHLIGRLRTESAHFGNDPVLEDIRERLQAIQSGNSDQASGPLPPVLPTIYIAGGMRLSLFSTIAQFGTAEDIALSELRIELMFPADEQTRLTLVELANIAVAP